MEFCASGLGTPLVFVTGRDAVVGVVGRSTLPGWHTRLSAAALRCGSGQPLSPAGAGVPPDRGGGGGRALRAGSETVRASSPDTGAGLDGRSASLPGAVPRQRGPRGPAGVSAILPALGGAPLPALRSLIARGSRPRDPYPGSRPPWSGGFHVGASRSQGGLNPEPPPIAAGGERQVSGVSGSAPPSGLVLQAGPVRFEENGDEHAPAAVLLRSPCGVMSRSGDGEAGGPHLSGVVGGAGGSAALGAPPESLYRTPSGGGVTGVESRIEDVLRGGVPGGHTPSGAGSGGGGGAEGAGGAPRAESLYRGEARPPREVGAPSELQGLPWPHSDFRCPPERRGDDVLGPHGP